MYFFGYEDSSQINIRIKDNTGREFSEISDKVKSMRGKCRKFLLAFPEVERIIKESTSVNRLTEYELVYASIFMELDQN